MKFDIKNKNKINNKAKARYILIKIKKISKNIHK